MPPGLPPADRTGKASTGPGGADDIHCRIASTGSALAVTSSLTCGFAHRNR
jgi:hypothetical protein